MRKSCTWVVAVVVIGALGAIRGEAQQAPFYADKLDLLKRIDNAGQIQPISKESDWQFRRNHILANMQKVMGLIDLPKSPPELRIEREEMLDNVVRKKIAIKMAEGDMVTGYLLVPRDAKGPLPAMLCLHQTTRIGSGEPAGVGGLKNLHYALELAERGYVTLAPDYPNFGDYKIDVYERGFVSATMKGILNHQRAIDVLQSLPIVDGNRIGCIGHSLGGHNSLFVAAFDPRIKVTVTSCGFNAFPKYYKGNLTGWSHKGYMPRIATEYQKDAKKMPFDFPEVLGAIAPRGVFINAPLGDDNFAVDGVKDCVQAALPVFALHGQEDNLRAVYPNAGHDFPREIRTQAYEFVDRMLKRSPSPKN